MSFEDHSPPAARFERTWEGSKLRLPSGLAFDRAKAQIGDAVAVCGGLDHPERGAEQSGSALVGRGNHLPDPVIAQLEAEPARLGGEGAARFAGRPQLVFGDDSVVIGGCRAEAEDRLGDRDLLGPVSDAGSPGGDARAGGDRAVVGTVLEAVGGGGGVGVDLCPQHGGVGRHPGYAQARDARRAGDDPGAEEGDLGGGVIRVADVELDRFAGGDFGGGAEDRQPFRSTTEDELFAFGARFADRADENAGFVVDADVGDVEVGFQQIDVAGGRIHGDAIDGVRSFIFRKRRCRVRRAFGDGKGAWGELCDGLF